MLLSVLAFWKGYMYLVTPYMGVCVHACVCFDIQTQDNLLRFIPVSHFGIRDYDK